VEYKNTKNSTVDVDIEMLDQTRLRPSV